MPDITLRWDDPAFDDLKMDYMRRAWGDAVPQRLAYDVSSVPIATIMTAAAQLERTFFDGQVPHGSIEWTQGWLVEGMTPSDDTAVLALCNPNHALAMIVINDRECRLVSYGMPYDAEKRQQQVGIDGVTIRSVEFTRIWGPSLWNRPNNRRHGQTCPSVVISTLPKQR